MAHLRPTAASWGQVIRDPQTIYRKRPGVRKVLSYRSPAVAPGWRGFYTGLLGFDRLVVASARQK